MDPLTLSALFGLGSNFLGGLFGGQQENDNRELTEEQFNRQMAQRQAEQGLQATQYDPFTQQRSRQRQALLGALMENFQPAAYDADAGRFTGGIMGITPEMLSGIQGFFGPNAMATQEQAFNQTAQAAAPTFSIPNYYGLGYQEGQGNLGADTSIGAMPPPSQQQQDLQAMQQDVRKFPFGGEKFAGGIQQLSENLAKVERFRNPRATLGQPNPQTRTLEDARRMKQEQPGELERILAGGR